MIKDNFEDNLEGTRRNPHCFYCFLHRNVLARVIRFQSLLSVVYLWFNKIKGRKATACFLYINNIGGH